MGGVRQRQASSTRVILKLRVTWVYPELLRESYGHSNVLVKVKSVPVTGCGPAPQL